MAWRRITDEEAKTLWVDFDLSEDFMESSRASLEASLHAHGWTGKAKRDREEEARQGLKNLNASRKAQKSK